MNYYYEVNDLAVNDFGGKYFAVYDRTGDAVMAGGWQLTQMSDRVWRETPDGVFFIKNRFVGPYDHDYLNLTDIEEFFMIKLKAKTYARRKQ